MPIDPTLLNNLPSALSDGAQHIIHGAENRIGQAGADAVLRAISRAISRIRGRGGEDDLVAQQDRLRTTLEALISELELQGVTARVEVESKEPAASKFIAAAIEDAIDSPSEGKRALLGRMIAHRLSVATESYYELVLRRSRVIAAGLNDSQLMLLGATMLTSATPEPPERFGTAREAATFFDAHYGEALTRFAFATWTRSDVQNLIAAGAIVEENLEELAARARHELPPRFSFAAEFPPRFGADDELQTIRQRVRGAFNVKLFPHSAPRVREPLSDLWLLPPGAIIAALVLEAHTRARILFPEWERIERDAIHASALVAPFSSNDLLTGAAEQRRRRSRALTERVNEQAPKALADDLRRSKPFRGF